MTVVTQQNVVGLRRSSLYSMVAIMLRLTLTLISIPILIKSLGLAQYGVWAVSISVLNLTTLARFGLDSALSFRLAETRAIAQQTEVQRVLGTSFVLFISIGFAVMLLMALASTPLATVLFSTSEPSSTPRMVLLVLAVVAFLQFWKQWAISTEVGLLRYDMIGFAESIGALVLQGGLIFFALLGSELVVLSLWYCVATLLTLLLHQKLLSRFIHLNLNPRIHWDRQVAHLLMRFGATQWLSILGGTLFSQLDRIMVNLVLGPSITGLYVAATSLVSKINELSAVPIEAIVPAMSMAKAQGQWERVLFVFSRAQRLNSIIIFLMVAVITFGAYSIASITVPSEYTSTLAMLIQIMAIAYGIYSLNATGYFSAIGLGMPGINARWVLTAGLIYVLLLSFLLAFYGLTGAAWANFAFIITVIINFQVARRIGITPRVYSASLLPFVCSIGFCWLFSVTLMSQPLWFQLAIWLALTIPLALWIAGRELLNELLQLVRVLKTRSHGFNHDQVQVDLT